MLEQVRLKSREGVIIECPLNYLFHDVVTVILMSQMGVSEMVVNVGNVVTVIYSISMSRKGPEVVKGMLDFEEDI